MIWSLLWILLMLGLVVTTIVVAVRENSARKKAAKQIMAAQPMPMSDEAGVSQPADDGFGGGVEFSEFDESSFK